MSTSMTVLVVDDEQGFTEGLTANLQREGYRAVVAHDGEAALKIFSDRAVDLVLLDLMLPGIDGMEICRRLRAHSTVPIIMLTARDDDIDKILGLEVGADDYLTKPFNFRELLARIRAIMRRVRRETEPKETLQGSSAALPVAPGIDLNIERQALVTDQGAEELLTVKEFALLELLAQHPRRVFGREELLDRVWGYDYYGSPRTVDVHVRRLRQKLEQLAGVEDGSEIVCTRWGAGYYLAGE